MREPLLLPEEIGPLIGYSPRTIRNQMQKNTLPFRWYRTGPRKRGAYLSDINKWIAKTRNEAGIGRKKKKEVNK